MPTTNKDMSDMMRGARAGLMDYMYPGNEESSEPTDTPTEETAEMTVLAPGEEDPPESYTYSQGEGGGWMVYPPGTPCPTDEYRVSLDHPATAEEFAQMQAALDKAGGSSDTADSSEGMYDESADGEIESS